MKEPGVFPAIPVRYTYKNIKRSTKFVYLYLLLRDHYRSNFVYTADLIEYARPIVCGGCAHIAKCDYPGIHACVGGGMQFNRRKNMPLHECLVHIARRFAQIYKVSITARIAKLERDRRRR